MIRQVRPTDIPRITAIYNHYIAQSTATFDTHPYTTEHMRQIVETLLARQHPYFVYETEGNVMGYSYAHPWKEREAYRLTAETSVYVAPGCTHAGIGTALTLRIIESCRQAGYHALIACITEGNEASAAMHEKLGFKKVSSFREVGFKFGQWLGITDYELVL